MAHISGGEVTYGRTVKTGDYENKRIDVKLTFGVDEGEDVTAILDRVSLLALNKAHEILGLPQKKVEAVAPQTARTVKAGKEAAAAVTAVETTQKPAAEAVVDEKKGAVEQAQISTGAERVDPAQVADELDEAPTDITDAQLADAAKQKNATLKDPVRIKALRDKYAGKTPSILSEIGANMTPAEKTAKRQAFLDELKKMQ